MYLSGVGRISPEIVWGAQGLFNHGGRLRERLWAITHMVEQTDKAVRKNIRVIGCGLFEAAGLRKEVSMMGMGLIVLDEDQET